MYLFSDESNYVTNGLHDWRSFLGSDAEATRYHWDPMNGDVAKSTVATINYSSGTTGLPKGVCVSHYNLIANVEQSEHMRHTEYAMEDRPPERWVSFLPLYHAFGQLYTCLLAAKLEIPTYVMKSFNFEGFLHVIQAYKITQVQLAPPIMVLLAKRPETARFDLSSLTNVGCGAAPLSAELQNEVMEKFHVSVIQGWGMTEVTCSGIGCPSGFVDECAYQMPSYPCCG